MFYAGQQYLAGYNYTLKYCRSADHTNVNALSRLPLQVNSLPSAQECPMGMVLYFNDEDNIVPLSCNLLRQETAKDSVLKFVLEYNVSAHNSDSVKPYYSKRYEISVVDDVLLWGQRVFIPYVLQDNV